MAGIFDSGIFDSGIFDVEEGAAVVGLLAGTILVTAAFEGTASASAQTPIKGGGRVIRRKIKIREDEKKPAVIGLFAGTILPPIGVFEGDAEAFNVEALNDQLLVLLAA